MLKQKGSQLVFHSLKEQFQDIQYIGSSQQGPTENNILFRFHHAVYELGTLCFFIEK